MKLFLINFDTENEDRISLSKKQREYSKHFIDYILKNIYKTNLTLKKDEKGKPYFKNSDLKISISHSKNLVALLFSKKDAGVDIEYIKDRNYQKILQHFNIFDKEITKEEFYAIWTIYEAEFKSKINKNTLSFKYNNQICSVSFDKEDLKVFEIIAKNKDDFSIQNFKLNKKDILNKPKAKI